MSLPVPSSSWYVVDGVVVSADIIPNSTRIIGRVTAARQEIRRQMTLSPAREEIRRRIAEKARR